jgi:hypothetical protein
MTAKYLLIPGVVRSNRDADDHYVGANRLALCYGVPISECVVYDPTREMTDAHKALLFLPVRFDGRYREALAALLLRQEATRNAPTDTENMPENADNSHFKEQFIRKNPR